MMKVKELMSAKVYTIRPEDTLDRVVVMFHFNAIRHSARFCQTCGQSTQA